MFGTMKGVRFLVFLDFEINETLQNIILVVVFRLLSQSGFFYNPRVYLSWSTGALAEMTLVGHKAKHEN